MLAPAIEVPRAKPMDNVARLDADTAWAAFMRRDRGMGRPHPRRRQNDGHLLQAELSCAAAKAGECRILPHSERGRASCRIPGVPALQARRGCARPAGSRERRRAHRAAEEAPSLGELATAVGYAPHHFQRIFKRDLGVSPAEYARGLAQSPDRNGAEGKWARDRRCL